jgi:hypothetical protein
LGNIVRPIFKDKKERKKEKKHDKLYRGNGLKEGIKMKARSEGQREGLLQESKVT